MWRGVRGERGLLQDRSGLLQGAPALLQRLAQARDARVVAHELHHRAAAPLAEALHTAAQGARSVGRARAESPTHAPHAPQVPLHGCRSAERQWEAGAQFQGQVVSEAPHHDVPVAERRHLHVLDRGELRAG